MFRLNLIIFPFKIMIELLLSFSHSLDHAIRFSCRKINVLNNTCIIIDIVYDNTMILLHREYNIHFLL